MSPTSRRGRRGRFSAEQQQAQPGNHCEQNILHLEERGDLRNPTVSQVMRQLKALFYSLNDISRNEASRQ